MSTQYQGSVDSGTTDTQPTMYTNGSERLTVTPPQVGYDTSGTRGLQMQSICAADEHYATRDEHATTMQVVIAHDATIKGHTEDIADLGAVLDEMAERMDALEGAKSGTAVPWDELDSVPCSDCDGNGGTWYQPIDNPRAWDICANCNGHGVLYVRPRAAAAAAPTTDYELGYANALLNVPWEAIKRMNGDIGCADRATLNSTLDDFADVLNWYITNAPKEAAHE